MPANAVTIANWPGRSYRWLPEKALRIGHLCDWYERRRESCRIDNQLRGRSSSGRSSESQFYLSLEDVMMRRFGSENQGCLDRFKLSEESVIKSKMLATAVAAQKRLGGGNNQVILKASLHMTMWCEQREIIYATSVMLSWPANRFAPVYLR